MLNAITNGRIDTWLKLATKELKPSIYASFK